VTDGISNTRVTPLRVSFPPARCRSAEAAASRASCPVDTCIASVPSRYLWVQPILVVTGA
jgi:hypothetical protein